MKAIFLTFIIFTNFPIYFCAPEDYEILWNNFIGVNGELRNLMDFSKIRVFHENGYAPEDYYINGTAIFRPPLDDTFSVMVRVLQDSNTYKYFPTMPACEFFKTVYKKYAEPMLINKTNFPIIPSDGLCPIPMGEYYINGAKLEDVYDILPRHLDDDFYFVEVTFLDQEKKDVGGFRIAVEVRTL